MFSALRAMFRDPEGKTLLVAAVVTIAVGTVVYMYLEGWSPIDALYFSVVTLATVGFGDLHPTTDAAKLFTVLYIISGLGIIAAFLSAITRYRGTGRRDRHRDHVEDDGDEPASSDGRASRGDAGP